MNNNLQLNPIPQIQNINNPEIEIEVQPNREDLPIPTEEQVIEEIHHMNPNIPNCQKKPLEVRDELGQTALFLAAKNGDYNEVIKLLKLGYDVNSQDNEGSTPLLAAIKYFDRSVFDAGKINYTGKQVSLIKVLLEAGANPNLAGKDGYTAYDWGLTLLTEVPDILRVLAQLKRTAPRFTNRAVDLLLATICNGARGDVFTLDRDDFFVCLDLFPECDFIGEEGGTFLHVLAKNNDREGVEIFAEKYPHVLKKYLNYQGKQQDFSINPSFLHLALEKCQDFSLAECFIKKGASIDLLSNLLFEYDLSIELLNWLIEKGVDINTQDSEGNTPLHYWIDHSYNSQALALSEKLIASGVDITVKNKNGETAIDRAVACENRRALELISQSPQALTINRSAIHAAAQSGDVEIFDKLLPTADLHEKDCFGFSLAEAAVYSGNIEIVKKLHEKSPLQKLCPLSWNMPETSSLLYLAVQCKNTDIFDFLLQCGFKEQLEDESSHAQQILSCAIANNWVYGIDWFLEKMPQSSYMWKYENLATVALQHSHEAVLERCFSVLKLNDKRIFLASLHSKNIKYATLLLPHADISIQDNRKNTILHLAVEMGDKGFVEEVLKQCSSEYLLTVKNEKKETVLDVALQKGDKEIAHLIFNHIKSCMLQNSNELSEGNKQQLIIQAVRLGIVQELQELLERPTFTCDLAKVIAPYIASSLCKVDLLSYAALLGKSEIVSLLLEKKAPLQISYEYSNSELLIVDKSLFCALRSKNPVVLEMIYNAYCAQNKTPFYENLFEEIVASKDEAALEGFWSLYIRAHNQHLDKGQTHSLTKLLLKLPKKLSSLHILKHGMSQQVPYTDLTDYLEEVILFCQDLKEHQRSALRTKKQLENDLQQIFYHIFQGMNPALGQEKHILKKISEMLKKVETAEDYGLLFTALQVTPSSESAKDACEVGQYINQYGSFPSRELLKLSTETELTNEEKQQVQKLFSRGDSSDIVSWQKKWFAYVSIYRSRQGLADCHRVLKNSQNYPEILLHVMRALESIAISRLSKQLANKQIKLLMAIAQEDKSDDVQIGAIKAMSALASYSNHTDIVRFLVEKLEHDASHMPVKLKIAILQSFDKLMQVGCEADSELIDAALLLTDDTDDDVRWQAVCFLSATTHEKALLRALEMIQNPACAGRYDEQYGRNKYNRVGNFLTFRSRPHHLHDNRAALLERIEHNLCALYLRDTQFLNQVEEIYNEFVEKPLSHPELVRVRNELNEHMKDSVRYMGTPLFFPEDSSLIRGLSNRKGKDSFQESIRDFIKKGSGTCALTDFEARNDGGTWKKIGHIFASHNADLFFGEETGCTYFSAGKESDVNESALIIFSSGYYEKEALAGQARIEIEGTYNNVLYRGIPKSWTTALYLPLSFQSDIKALSGDVSIKEVKKTLTHETFKDLSEKELKELRRQLKAEEIDWTSKELKKVSFSSKIRFFPKGNAAEVKKKLVEDGLKFVSEDDVREATIKKVIGRELVRKMYREKQNNPILFSMPEHLITELSMQDFFKAYKSFKDMLPKQISTVLPDEEVVNNYEYKNVETIENVFIEVQGSIKGRALFRLVILSLLSLQNNKQLTVSDVARSLRFNPEFFGLTSEDVKVVIALIEGDKNSVQSGHIQQHMFERLSQEILKMNW